MARENVQIIDLKPRSPQDALASTVEVPATLESGSEQYLHDLAVKSAEAYYLQEEKRIQDAFDATSGKLAHEENRGHGLIPGVREMEDTAHESPRERRDAHTFPEPGEPSTAVHELQPHEERSRYS
jgi:hypothetical protein